MLHPEYGGSMDLWNDGILPQHYTASQPIRTRLAIFICNSVSSVLNLWQVVEHILKLSTLIRISEIFSGLNYLLLTIRGYLILCAIFKDLICTDLSWNNGTYTGQIQKRFHGYSYCNIVLTNYDEVSSKRRPIPIFPNSVCVTVLHL